MTALHLHVPFTSSLPPVDVIVARLSQLTEEVVSYEESRCNLVCPTVGDEFGLYPGDENQYILTSFAHQPTYLFEATLVVLQALGGTYAAPLPERAHQPWRIASKYY
jgi:hypothetical protein